MMVFGKLEVISISGGQLKSDEPHTQLKFSTDYIKRCEKISKPSFNNTFT